MKRFAKFASVLAILVIAGCTSESALKSALEKNPDLIFDVIKKNPDKFMDAASEAQRAAQEVQAKKQEEG